MPRRRAASPMRTLLARSARLPPALALVLLGALLYLPGLGRRDLWNPDEPRYAEVAREMAASGEVLVPHLNGEVYSHKPPLFFWAIAAAGAATGRLDETAARLPSALAAIACLPLLFALARRFFGPRAAWLAALVQATAGRLLWQGRCGQIDMLLSFLVLAAVYLWVRGYLERRPAFGLGFFAVTGLATLTKGPVGLLPALLAGLVFLLWRREREALRRLPLGRGIALWAAVVLAWLLPAAARAPGAYLSDILVTQNLVRYAAPAEYGGTKGHQRPPHYYLTALPGDFFPWSLLLPGTALIAWRESPGGRRRQGVQFALAWAAVTVVFFSLSPGKRSVYILQMYPALALLVGAGLDRAAVAGRRYRRWLALPAGLAAGVLLLAAAAAPFAPARVPDLARLPADLPVRLGLAFLLPAAGAAVAALLAGRDRPVAAAGAIAGGMAVFAVVAGLFLLPPFDALKSPRLLADPLAARLKTGEPYAHYPGLEPRFLFYLGRPAVVLPTREALANFLRGHPRPWVLAAARDLTGVELPPGVVVVASEAVARDGWVLLGPAGG